MAFTNRSFGDTHKIRIRLSIKAAEIVRSDMEVFQIKTYSDFINTVIQNYRDEASASKTLYLQKKRQEILKALYKCSLDPKVLEQICNALIEKEENALKTKLKEYMRHNRTDDIRLQYISKNNTDFLEGKNTTGNSCLEDESEFFKTPGDYLRCIIEEFCELPFSARERIVRKEIFTEIEDAIRAHDCLRVLSFYKREPTYYHVKPYKILNDTLGGQSYLVCLSFPEKEPGLPLEPARIASFTIFRMNKPERIRSDSTCDPFFTKEEITEIQNRLSTTPPAYLTFDEEEIHVRLTEEGKRKYNNLLYSRPILDKEKSSEYEYVFFCSTRQAYNYFFSFGKDAEICSPDNLRNWIARDYKHALDIYNYTGE